MEMGICSFKYAAGRDEIMARYPAFPLIFPDDVKKGVDYVYGRIQQWSAAFINELDTRDQIQEGKPTSNIYAVLTYPLNLPLLTEYAISPLSGLLIVVTVTTA